MEVIYRVEWGARPATEKTRLLPDAVKHLVIHYSAADADEQANHANCAARVRAIQNFHMSPSPSDPTKPWSDIAYNWLVCKHGYIFRGRGWGYRSAATGTANSFTVACCFLGDDTKGRADVTPEAKQAIRSVYAYVKKWTPRKVTAKGHRDFMATSCPGDELYAFLKTLKPEGT
jgi:hypothetical protein